MINLGKYASAIYSLPYEGVASNWRSVWEEKGILKSLWRRLKRDLTQLITGQIFLLRESIPENSKRILVIYRGRHQLGDSIQELSGRALLKSSAIKIDLLAEKEIAEIYADDPSFNLVFSDPKEISNAYDFVILMTMTWRNMGLKFKHCPLTPYAAIYGYSHGIEVDQLGLSYAAFAHISHRNYSSCKSFFNLKYSHEAVVRDSQAIAIAIAVGGLGPDRIYRQWKNVVELLYKSKGNVAGFKIYLIGSGNGKQAAKEILDALNGRAEIHDHVGKTS